MAAATLGVGDAVAEKLGFAAKLVDEDTTLRVMVDGVEAEIEEVGFRPDLNELTFITKESY